jgi:hypothetical protein
LKSLDQTLKSLQKVPIVNTIRCLKDIYYTQLKQVFILFILKMYVTCVTKVTENLLCLTSTKDLNGWITVEKETKKIYFQTIELSSVGWLEKVFVIKATVWSLLILVTKNVLPLKTLTVELPLKKKPRKCISKLLNWARKFLCTKIVIIEFRHKSESKICLCCLFDINF